MDDDSGSFVKNRAKRQRPDKGGRFAALERLKQVKEGTRSKYELKEEASVYDEVDETEYSRLVQERQEDEWIVDDGGSGYVEDGREIFDDDIGEEQYDAPKKAKTAAKNLYKPPGSKKPGEKAGTIAAMFAQQPKKKAENHVTVNDDELLDSILGSVSSTEAKPAPAIPSRPPPAKNKFATSKKPPTAVPAREVAKHPSTSYNGRSGTFNNYTELKDVYVKEEPLSIDEFQSEDLMHNSPDIEDNSPADAALKREDYPQDEDMTCILDEGDDDFLADLESESTKPEPAASVKKETAGVKEEVASVKREATKETENGFPQWRGVHTEEVAAAPDISLDDLPTVQNQEGESVIHFFWLDAFEDYFKNPGTVHLFGKVKIPDSQSHMSCCVTVKNIPRRLFLLPRESASDDAEESAIMKNVYSEFTQIAEKHRIEEFKTKVTTKLYAFGKAGVPAEARYLEILYPAHYPALPSDLTGNTFSAAFGMNTSSLEALLINQKLKGPCWLELKNPTSPSVPVSWCKVEVVLNRPEDVVVVPKSEAPPPLVAVTLSLRTVHNPSTSQNEIVAVSVLAHHAFPIDKQAPQPPYQSHFCALTKPSGTIFPIRFKNDVARFKSTSLQVMDSERSLLTFLIARLQKLDPDILIGHDIQSFELDVLLHRMLAHKIPNWSRLGRLKRGNAGALGKSADKQITPGRLVCDAKVSSKELVQCKSYDLSELVRTLLQKERLSLTAEQVLDMYRDSSQLLRLVELTMMDAEFCLRVVGELNALPLALQITNIAGNLMSKTLLGGRSQRNEYLLLHAFSGRNYICPDKVYKKQGPKAQPNEDDDEEAQHSATNKKAKKGPSYAGGLVLEPKKGFYDSFILLMDFNSLYPSIIQEYNICFTTVSVSSSDEAKEEDYIPKLPNPSLEQGVLPSEIRKLVERRKQVKTLMKGAEGDSELYQQYDIRQKALKLTANSMYGCLGFASSRFYAKPLAALITSRGREILMQSKELVEKMGFEVIYGDTDSIMINTNSRDFKEVLKLGNKIKAEINRFYKQLEIDIDGIFKSMLLLKKKKYAAVCITVGPNNQQTQTRQLKGLDIVRRDWSEVARKTGQFVIDQILSESLREEIVDKINTFLMQLATKIQENSLPVSDYCITKQLTKNPEDYPDKKNLCHVQVALRLNSKGGKKLRQGDTVTYVICNDGSQLPASQRAYHPEEMKTNDSLSIDKHYYLSQQVHPVVARICAPIEGTDAAMIAEVLGLDPHQYRNYSYNKDEDPGAKLSSVKMLNLSDYKDCQRMSFHCPADDCAATIAIEHIFEGTGKNLLFSLESCPGCKAELSSYLNALCNQMTLTIRSFIHKFYLGWLVCEDSGCGHRTRQVSLRFGKSGPICVACQRSAMLPEYKVSDLYRQLTYFSKLFDFSRAQATLSEIEKTTYQIPPGVPDMKQVRVRRWIVHQMPCVTRAETERTCRHLQQVVKRYLARNAFSIVSMADFFRDAYQPLTGRANGAADRDAGGLLLD
ncbi:DNA polymerase alpha catalytic subunit isoform X1 [Haemaphysalis longicornis]